MARSGLAPALFQSTLAVGIAVACHHVSSVTAGPVQSCLSSALAPRSRPGHFWPRICGRPISQLCRTPRQPATGHWFRRQYRRTDEAPKRRDWLKAWLHVSPPHRISYEVDLGQAGAAEDAASLPPRCQHGLNFAAAQLSLFRRIWPVTGFNC